MMKLITGQFNDSYFPIMDGVGMTAHNYANWLNEKYGKSILIAPKVKDYSDHVDYKVFRFKSLLLPGMNPYRVGLPMIDVKFRKRLNRVKIDLLHAHCPFISGQLALKLARRLDIPLVATFHTKYREDFKKVLNNDLFVDFLLKITMEFYQTADYVWVPNKATADTLQGYGFDGQIEIVPNGTDMAIPDKTKLIKYRKKGLEAMGAGRDEFVLLFVGQHRWEKNVRLIIEAVGKLKDSTTGFKMVFVGEGYAAKEMKKLVRDYNLKNEITFLGLVTERKELQNLYAASDLFVFPSVYDNAPLVMQEAAAFDVPSIVVKNTSAAEDIHDGVNGFLVDNDADSLSRKILDLVRNPVALRRAGMGARKTIYHPWEDIVDRVYTRYTEIVTAHSSVNQGKNSQKPYRV